MTTKIRKASNILLSALMLSACGLTAVSAAPAAKEDNAADTQKAAKEIGEFKLSSDCEFAHADYEKSNSGELYMLHIVNKKTNDSMDVQKHIEPKDGATHKFNPTEEFPKVKAVESGEHEIGGQKVAYAIWNHKDPVKYLGEVNGKTSEISIWIDSTNAKFSKADAESFLKQIEKLNAN